MRVAYWTVVAPTRQEALDLADRHHQPTAYDRAVTLAWTQAQVQLRHLGISADEAHVFQRIANRVLYADPTLRPSSDTLQRNHFGPSILWPHGISGDLPIVLVRIDEIADMEIVRQLFRAHEYWRMKQLAVDLVILNERPPSYAQDLQSGIEAAARMSQTRTGEGVGGKVFILRSDLVSVDARTALQSVARAVLLSRRGSVAEQVKRLREVAPNTVPPARRPASYRVAEATSRRPELAHFNGLGGFSPDGKGICDDPRPGPDHARALDQCDRQSILRLRGLRRGRLLQLVGQQPGEPAHALVERSRHRSAGRSHLSARRGERRCLEPDGAPHPRGDLALSRPPWSGL